MSEPINVKCPSCDEVFATADESDMVNVLRAPLRRERPGNAARQGKGERRRPVARFRRLQRPTYQRNLMSRLEREARQEASAIG